MQMADDRFHIGVISHKRPQNVDKMSNILGNVVWYVGAGEYQIYRDHGAEFVQEIGGLCDSRNAILDDAFAAGKIAVEFSDDLSKIKEAYVDGDKKKARQISLQHALDKILEAMDQTGAMMGGVAPTANPFFFHPEKPVSTKHFIVGDMIVVKPCELRFDNKMRLKEDYDYTLQHIEKYGCVARENSILATFAHRTNKGGAVAYRTSKVENEAIEYLQKKWPGKTRPNPRRKDEILLKL